MKCKLSCFDCAAARLGRSSTVGSGFRVRCLGFRVYLVSQRSYRFKDLYVGTIKTSPKKGGSLGPR